VLLGGPKGFEGSVDRIDGSSAPPGASGAVWRELYRTPKAFLVAGGGLMPRSRSHRRQDIRHRRRQARRSLNQFLLDDDLVIPEEEWPETLVESLPQRYLTEPMFWLAPEDPQDQ
jgi:hypothetical protein